MSPLSISRALLIGALSKFTLLFSLQSSAFADEKTTKKDTEKLESQLVLAPYLWLPNLSGKIQFQGLSVPIEQSAPELFTYVKAGGMGHLQFQKGDNFIYAETILMDYSDKSSDLFFGQSVKATIIFTEMGSGRNFSLRKSNTSSLTLSPYLGLRYTNISTGISGPGLNAKTNDYWLDPVIGFKSRKTLNHKLILNTKIDAAGLNISNNKYMSAVIDLEYHFSEKTFFNIGYRWSTGSYRSKNGLNFDLEGHGPVLGLKYTFSSHE